jgi:hypothetical protein
MLEMGTPIPSPDEALTEFTKHTLYAFGDVFLSYIAVHPFHTVLPHPTTRAPTTPPVVVVPWEAWGPDPLAPDDGAESIGTKPRLQKVCGMHACHAPREPHSLLDKRILHISDCDPHRVARALAAAHGHEAVIPAAEEEKD